MKYGVKNGWLSLSGGVSVSRPFCACITGLNERFGYEREFHGTKEIRDEDGKSVGWRTRFPIAQGDIIEIGGWEETDPEIKQRRYLQFEGGKLHKLDSSEVKRHFGEDEVGDNLYPDDVPF